LIYGEVNVVEKRVTYLLGAGASGGAGLPSASQLTAQVLDILKTNGESNSDLHLWRAMSYVVDVSSSFWSKASGRTYVPDIETVISAIELLSRIDELEIRPFIAELSQSDEILESADQGYRPFSLLRIDLMGAFAELLHEVPRILRQLLSLSDTSNVNYLHPLAELAQREQVTVATLNYDLTLERAAAETGVNFSDGIEQWNKNWALKWPSPGLKIIKLHGSLDWENVYHAQENLTFGGSEVGESKGFGVNSYPFIVFGRREKLRPQGPFLDLRAEFASELRRTSHLVVIGYSFGDDHVNELIRKWHSSGSDRVLVVVDPNFPATFLDWKQPFQWEILTALQKQAGAVIGSVTDSTVLILRNTIEDVTSIVFAGPSVIDVEIANAYPQSRHLRPIEEEP
jgi:hypothetical protein